MLVFNVYLPAQNVKVFFLHLKSMMMLLSKSLSMKKLSLLFSSFLLALSAFAQVESVVIEKSNFDNLIPNAVTPIVSNEARVMTVDMPQSVVRENLLQNNQDPMRDGLDHKRILRPGESIIFSVNNNAVIEDDGHFETLSSSIENAIDKVPEWMRYDLRFKFSETTTSSVRTKMVDLINSTPKKYLDEVAFVLTYLPVEVLTSSRFINDWEHILHNAELIYAHADSLKYVRIKEVGDTASGNWYTTTEYKIKQGSNYIWREIDKYYYYQFIVMPKLEQEGVYVTDNNTSITAQRTWGYFWRDYLWNDYFQAVNTSDTEDRSYRNVNMCGYVAINSAGNRDTVCIDTVPRLGELMQMPEYLWNESPTIYFFNRAFSSTQSALDVLGNWASRCVPQDVTSNSDYRPSQPNHIAWKHVGNCHEDALLVVAAARTALIPCMHVADLCDDHVWTVIHDGNPDMEWHHYEFFRGGLSASRPYYWGMTNMQETGNYGWNSSLVQGYVPDGRLVNLSEKYSENNACTLNLTISDQDGVPVDGAEVHIYSTNYQYSSSDPYVMSAGYLWTDAQGKISVKLGTGNKYYMKVSHPKFGSFPETSGQVYNVLSNKTTAGATYNKSFTFPTAASAARNSITSAQTEFSADKSMKLTLVANNINTGSNPEDGQSSTFYDRTATLAGLHAYVVDEANIDKFRNGNLTADVEYDFGTLAQGSYNIPIHQSGNTYVVLSNSNNYINYVEVEYSTEMVNGAEFFYVGVEDHQAASFQVYPNPANDQIHIVMDGSLSNNGKVQLFDISGKMVLSENIQSASSTIDVSDLRPGLYFVKFGTAVSKFVKQ